MLPSHNSAGFSALTIVSLSLAAYTPIWYVTASNDAGICSSLVTIWYGNFFHPFFPNFSSSSSSLSSIYSSLWFVIFLSDSSFCPFWRLWHTTCNSGSSSSESSSASTSVSLNARSSCSCLYRRDSFSVFLPYILWFIMRICSVNWSTDLFKSMTLFCSVIVIVTNVSTGRDLSCSSVKYVSAMTYLYCIFTHSAIVGNFTKILHKYIRNRWF